MAAEQAIKCEILRNLKSIEPEDSDDPFAWPDVIDDENADVVWNSLGDHERLNDWRDVASGEFRASGERVSGLSFGETYSRHYEAYRVARRLDDGRWVGWIYWYGGGKHGEPESIEWMDDAVFLTCTEEEKVVVVRTFAEVS